MMPFAALDCHVLWKKDVVDEVAPIHGCDMAKTETEQSNEKSNINCKTSRVKRS